jgi:hypothetical protein
MTVRVEILGVLSETLSRALSAAGVGNVFGTALITVTQTYVSTGRWQPADWASATALRSPAGNLEPEEEGEYVTIAGAVPRAPITDLGARRHGGSRNRLLSPSNLGSVFERVR